MGPDRFYARLAVVDPVTAAKLHPRDTSKVIRALEVHQLSGSAMSSFHANHGFAERAFSALIIGLNREREQLYRRIEARIDWQLDNGLIDETRRLLAEGYQRDGSAMKGLGYRHVAAYLAGEYSRDEMVRRFKRDTRRFAKRQMTWFRREGDITWLMLHESEPLEQTVRHMTRLIESFLESVDTEATPASEQRRGDDKEHGQVG